MVPRIQVDKSNIKIFNKFINFHIDTLVIIERKALLDMPFSREITKEEQADMGKLKKSVKGLVVVHPMTKLGKELRLDAMTGFAPKKF